MCALGHSEAQSQSQINLLACFHLLGLGTQARVSRGDWVQTRFWVQTGFKPRTQGRKVTCGSFVIGGATERLQRPLLHSENHTGLNSPISLWLMKIPYACTDRLI